MINMINLNVGRRPNNSEKYTKSEECVKLSFPCEREGNYSEYTDACPLLEDGHGHITFYKSGLVWHLPIPIDSSSFIGRIVMYARDSKQLISEQISVVIMSMPEVRRLPHPLTDREKMLLADPVEWERLWRPNFI